MQALAPMPLAIELRHRGWMDRRDATLGWFRDVGAAFVCVDAPATKAPVAMPREDAVHAGTWPTCARMEGYLRGRSAAERFDYAYSDAELRGLAARARALADAAERVACVLANGGHARKSALALRELLQ